MKPVSPKKAGDRDRARRQRARRYGIVTEHLAAIALRMKGYRILARNFRSPMGEIDILARRGNVIAVVEVKARNDIRSAVDAVGFNSRQRIARAARSWLSGRPDATELSLRFDIVAVVPWRWPVHLENAF